MLDIAKANIEENFGIVGLQEKFDETLILIRQNLGWKMPFYTKKNMSKTNIKNRKFKSNKAVEIIKYYNRLDMELHRYVSERFENFIHNQKVNFQLDLQIFKALNMIYSSQVYLFLKSIKNRAGI